MNKDLFMRWDRLGADIKTWFNDFIRPKRLRSLIKRVIFMYIWQYFFMVIVMAFVWVILDLSPIWETRWGGNIYLILFWFPMVGLISSYIYQMVLKRKS